MTATTSTRTRLRPPRGPRGPRQTAGVSDPVHLDPPPAYFADLPDFVLRDGNGACERIMDGLARRGIYVRPILAEIEAERARRGLRSGVIVSAEPAPAQVVLPMGPGVSEISTESGARRSALSEEARRNRARIKAALDGTVAKPRREPRPARPRPFEGRLPAEIAEARTEAA